MSSMGYMDGLPPSVATILIAVGGIYCATLLLRALCALLQTVKTFVGAKNLRDYGSWAIVTGSTDGIGKAIAKQLARQKINLLLISRNQDKLSSVAQEIVGEYGVEVKTQALDMSTTTKEDYTNLYNSHGKLDIGIIVNNVGLSYDHPEYLEAADQDRLWKMIQMNTIPCTMLTQQFLAHMVNKKKGLVVNVGSMSGVLSTPLLSVYSASKAYVHTVTESLRQEYADKGIHFQVLCPMFVATAMTGMRTTLMCPKPDTYARSAVATFGKSAFTSGYWPHSLQATLYSCAPKFYFNANQLKVMKKGRARWYRKQEAKKE